MKYFAYFMGSLTALTALVTLLELRDVFWTLACTGLAGAWFWVAQR